MAFTLLGMFDIIWLLSGVLLWAVGVVLVSAWLVGLRFPARRPGPARSANWQESLRYGTLVIVPPARVRRTVDGLRAEYDPASHSFFGTHITLTQPLVRQPREDDWARLGRLRLDSTPSGLNTDRPIPSFPIPASGSGFAQRNESCNRDGRSTVSGCSTLACPTPTTSFRT
jgi:hypothetical protein